MFEIVDNLIMDFISHLDFYIVIFLAFGFLGTFFFNKR